MSSDRISFWSTTVDRKKNIDIKQTQKTARFIHITNIALGENPADGPHTVLLSVRGMETVVIATLHPQGYLLQHGLDLVLDSNTLIINTGGSAVHLTGYTTSSTAEDYEEAPAQAAQGTKVSATVDRVQT